ncbi:hypothetical protein MAPG_07884 [Magnaporthiopsis poae ATCC 64411]|uniref:Uncharacterized protein n=1 Tax=Magnaporthiopsis poae (strain ATCC 64411 / 73-15) TaxID=644358 RepID=A0A0C4E5V7_MAGP6|nr:hypothetical protein MAPG_07884 [Magnaporthiopsis poae ATCC 64411]
MLDPVRLSYKTGTADRPKNTRTEKPNTRCKVLGGSSCLSCHAWITSSAATHGDYIPYGGGEWSCDAVRPYASMMASARPAGRLLEEKKNVTALSRAGQRRGAVLMNGEGMRETTPSQCSAAATRR